jgi:hypothetical protein
VLENIHDALKIIPEAGERLPSDQPYSDEYFRHLYHEVEEYQRFIHGDGRPREISFRPSPEPQVRQETQTESINQSRQKESEPMEENRPATSQWPALVQATALAREAEIHDDAVLRARSNLLPSENDRTEVDKLRKELDAMKTKFKTAGDECLMLRYKNSLLERVLLERGTSFKFYITLHQLNAVQELMSWQNYVNGLITLIHQHLRIFFHRLSPVQELMSRQNYVNKLVTTILRHLRIFFHRLPLKTSDGPMLTSMITSVQNALID